MALDTKIFDDAIAAKVTDIQSAQADVDTDSFISEQKAAQAKASDLAKKQNEKVSLETKKARAIELDAIITAATIELDAIKLELK